MNPSAFGTGRHLVAKHGSTRQPAEFSMMGRTWDLLPEVFAPCHTASTELFSTELPYPVGGRFLEIGCGAGLTSVVAALRGCAAVVAVDISAPAVENTRLNVERHGVADRVTVRHGDMFDALDPDDRFDLVFWNSNVIEAPGTFRYERDLEYAIFDRGYQAHDRYLHDGPGRLGPRGRLMLGYNDLGDQRRLDDLATRQGLRAVTRARLHSRTGDTAVEFRLLELLATAAPANR